MTIFTGFPASSPLQSIFDSTKDAAKVTQCSRKGIMTHCKNLRQKLDQMNKFTITTLSTETGQEKQKLVASRAHANFAVGDFVLVASTTQVKLPKLMPRWTGPYRVTRTINDWIHEVQHLATAKKS
jgi:hypothetical protein